MRPGWEHTEAAASLGVPRPSHDHQVTVQGAQRTGSSCRPDTLALSQRCQAGSPWEAMSAPEGSGHGEYLLALFYHSQRREVQTDLG